MFHNIMLECQASNFWKLTSVFWCGFLCLFADVYTPETHQLSFSISLSLLKHSRLPYLVSGAVRQYGSGRLFVLASQWLPSSLRQLSEHQRRPVGDVAQHPPGPAGEQHGPQRGTVPLSTPCRNISSSQRCLACIITTGTVLANIFNPLLKSQSRPRRLEGLTLTWERYQEGALCDITKGTLLVNNIVQSSCVKSA